MYDTTPLDAARAARRFTLWTGLALLLFMALGTALLAKIGPISPALAWAMAAIAAAASLAMAALVGRTSPYPRWSIWTAGACMAGALLLSVPLAGDPSVWSEDYRTGAWMLPWFLLVIGTVRGSRREGVCAPAHPAAGWIVVSATVLMSLILLGSHVLVATVGRMLGVGLR